MNLQCNIDQRGRKVRMMGGYLFLILSVAAGIALWITGKYWLAFPATGGFLVGGVMLYEASHGWCMIRSMGIKTPL